MEIDNPEEVTKLENEFAEEIRKRGEDFKYFKDQFGEHPEERAVNEEMSEKLEEVLTINEIYGALKEKVPKIEPIRIPINQEKVSFMMRYWLSLDLKTMTHFRVPQNKTLIKLW